MVDSVSYNPFSGKVLTPEEIEKLDTNKDKKISNDEFQAGMSWLSGGPDEEGGVDLGETATLTASGNKIYDKSLKSGVKGTAEDSAQLKEYMATVQDVYIEQYMQSSADLSAEEKSSLIVFIKTTGAAFMDEYIQKNTKMPYDTKAVGGELMAKLDTAIAARKESIESTKKEVSDLKSNTDGKYDKLTAYADKADDDFVTSAEYKEMKQQAIEYIMSQLMNGKENEDFLKGLDANYKTNANYKVAEKAIKDLETATDPVKIKDLIKQAQEALDKFIGAQNMDGTSKLNNSINAVTDKKVSAEKAAEIDAYKETLSKLNDSLLDSFARTRNNAARDWLSKFPNEEQIDEYKTKLNNVLTAFMAQYKGDGKNIEYEYNVFLTKSISESDAVTRSLSDGKTDSADKYAELKDTVNGIGSNLGPDDKTKILDKTSEFVLNELSQGKNDITLLKSIYPGYAADKNFVEAEKLMSSLKTSATPKEDLAKATELIKTMLTTVGAEKIIDGVNNKKTSAISFDAIDREALTSSISGYDNNESISTGRYKYRDDSIDDIQNQAKQKLEELRSKLHAQLKQQMGADYDKAQVDGFIDDAIYKTITQFTDMRVDKNGKHYTTDDAGFVTSKSGSKSRGVVNIRQLVDAFLTNFQELSAKASQPADPSKNPVDRLDVMGDTSLADAYQDKKTSVTTDKADARLRLKTQLNIIANQLKAKLKAQLGSDYNSSQIDKLIEQATYNVVSDDSALSPTRGHTNRFLGIFKSAGWDIYNVNTQTIANKFFDEFDKLYEDANKDKKKPEETPAK